MPSLITVGAFFILDELKIAGEAHNLLKTLKIFHQITESYRKIFKKMIYNDNMYKDETI